MEFQLDHLWLMFGCACMLLSKPLFKFLKNKGEFCILISNVLLSVGVGGLINGGIVITLGFGRNSISTQWIAFSLISVFVFTVIQVIIFFMKRYIVKRKAEILKIRDACC